DTVLPRGLERVRYRFRSRLVRPGHNGSCHRRLARGRRQSRDSRALRGLVRRCGRDRCHIERDRDGPVEDRNGGVAHPVFPHDPSGARYGSTPMLMSGPRPAHGQWSKEYFHQVDSDMGTVEGGGWYREVTSVLHHASTVAASAGQTYRFSGWSGGVTSADASVTVTMT